MGGESRDLLESELASRLRGIDAVSADLVSKTLRCDDSNLVANPLVGLEIERQLRVVSLDDDLRRFLHRLGTDSTHDCGVGE